MKRCCLEVLAVGLTFVAASACSSAREPPIEDEARSVCATGETVGCACSDGTQSWKSCTPEKVFEPCRCGDGSSTASSAPEPAEAGSSMLASGDPPETSGEEQGERAVYRIPLRVHIGRSALGAERLLAVLEEMNSIWLTQAGVCFEIHTVADGQVMEEGFDLWFTAGSIPGASPRTNGIYRGSHDIWTIDDPRLSSSPNPVAYDAARTAAHELGHGLSLGHQNCGFECPCGASLGLNCDDLLMRSGTTGFFLSEVEVAVARDRAAERALDDTAPRACGAPRID